MKSSSLTKRIVIYFVGMLVLSFGIVLNTKASLGVSPIITVSYTISRIWKLNFSNITFLLYSTFVVIEITIRSIQRKWKELPFILLQIALSLAFTRVMDIYDRLLPDLGGVEDSFAGTIPFRVLILLLAIFLIGLGIVLTVEPDLIPNPADGIVYVISDTVGKSMGIIKNTIDITCVCISCIICILNHERITGVGIGTILAMLLCGRVVALTTKPVKKLLDEE